MFFVVLLRFFARVCTCHLHTCKSCWVVVVFFQFFIYHYFVFIYVSSAPQVYLHSCLRVCMSSYYAPTHCLPRVCVPPACVPIVLCLFSFFLFHCCCYCFLFTIFILFLFMFQAYLHSCLRVCIISSFYAPVRCLPRVCVPPACVPIVLSLLFISFFHCCCYCFLFCYYYFVFICVSDLPAPLFVSLHDRFLRAYSRVALFIIII